MNDLEICKRIADIEKIYYIETKYSDGVNFLGLVNEPDGCGTPPELIGEYNPLTDDALCFQLMVKHKITMNWHTAEYKAWVMIKAKSYSVTARTPNKAICLVIVEANNGVAL